MSSPLNINISMHKIKSEENLSAQDFISEMTSFSSNKMTLSK